MMITPYDIHLFKQGSHTRLYRKLGAQIEKGGTHFAVWAPNAEKVSIIGDFNGWRKGEHPLSARWDESGIWEGVIPGVLAGACYKYHIVSRSAGYSVDKADPYAFYSETAPNTASRVWSLDYDWQDADWIARRSRGGPTSIYQIHLGSFPT